jgi:tetratricopeptide (TPR) repeat protein
MASFERYESDPDEYLTRDLLELRELVEDDPHLLRSEQQRIREIIQRGLSSDYHYFSAVGTIFYMLSPAIGDPESKPWFEPILDVIEQHPTAEGNLFEAGFQEMMHDFRALTGVCVDLSSTRPIIVDALLQVYIKLIRLLIFKPDLTVPPNLFDQVLAIAQRLGDHVEKDRLYQTLALYYSHNGEFEMAERYALMAYNDAEYIDDPERIVDAACTLAIVYRVGVRMSKGDFYIRRAMSKGVSSEATLRFGTLFYENGAACYRRDRFDQSRSYYLQALAIFEECGAAYQIAMTKQALAMTAIYQGNFSEAETLLQVARSAWEQLGTDYEWVNSFFVEGDLELKRGNRTLAIQTMRKAIDMAYSRLAETPMREFLIQRIREHIERNS